MILKILGDTQIYSSDSGMIMCAGLISPSFSCPKCQCAFS